MTRAKRAGLVFGAVVALAAVVVATSLADRGSIKDPKGDVQNNPDHKADFDIVKATWGHAKHGKLVHKVKVDGKIGNPDNGQGVFPQMYFDVPGKVGNSYCDYKLQPDAPHTPNNSTDHVKANLYKCGNDNLVPVGTGQIKRVKPDTDKFVITKKLIGSPNKYGWFFQTITDSNQGIVEADRAPDHGFKEHNL
jgi:hypothetical protein